MSNPVDVVPDVLVLAAIERAALHRARETPGVPVWAILEHLDIPRRSMHARAVRPRLDVLEAEGSLERSRRHSVPLWALTSAGRRRLGRARRAGQVAVLPESPQHRAWREARALAQARLDEFIDAASEARLRVFYLLEGARDGSVSSDVWFELSKYHRRSLWQLGSAIHCLHEWPEPDDERADIDDHSEPGDEQLDPAERKRRRARRGARRSVGLWRDDVWPLSEVAARLD